MSGGNKRSYILKQTSSLKLQVCLSMYDILLPPGITGLNTNVAKFHDQYCFKKYFKYFATILSNREIEH